MHRADTHTHTYTLYKFKLWLCQAPGGMLVKVFMLHNSTS